MPPVAISCLVFEVATLRFRAHLMGFKKRLKQEVW